LAGLASQFRPNLVLVPLLLAGYLALFARRRRWTAHAAAIVGCAALTLAPWVVRNYRLTRMVVPTSLHSGVQLWYGSLQVGPYLHSRAYNPRTIFESPVFEYTSLDRVPLIVTAVRRTCGTTEPLRPTLVYWSDRDATRRTSPGQLEGGTLTFEAPAPPPPAVFYYYLTADWTRSGGTVTATTPPHGGATPLAFFVSRDHLGDLDLHGDLVDSFDLIRLMRHLAWGEPLPFADRLAAAGVDVRRIDSLVAVLERRFELTPADAVPATLAHDDRQVQLTFPDGSSLVVPRQWQGLITDVAFQGALASGVMSSTEPVETVRHPASRGSRADDDDPCMLFEQVSVNAVFYRREPHLMGRYTALALDNIRRTPLQFAAASAYRMLRLFVIHGDDDPRTSQQFAHGGRVYAAGTIASGLFAALFVSGAIIAWRQGEAIALPLLLILYVPFTIAPMLTNMRYTVTVQPLAFLFVAASLNALLQRVGLLPAPRAALDPGES
jgi:hypothetical protein